MNLCVDFIQKFSVAYIIKCKPLCQELKLPQTAFDILMFLANNPDYKTASDIVEFRKIKANLVSVNVNKLVEEGYLRRENVKGDRRKIQLICTDKAIPIIERGRNLQSSFFKTIFDNTSEEARESFSRTIETISKNLDVILEERN